MKLALAELLECPKCNSDLDWDISKKEFNKIIEASAKCNNCSNVYPIKNGIGIFLTDDLERIDLWEMVDNNLTSYLKSHPDLNKKLMDSDVEKLNSADVFFRSMILEDRMNFKEAKKISEIALKRIYTKEYIECHEKQIQFINNLKIDSNTLIIDLASGKGQLVKILALKGNNHVVMTDFSPSIIQKDQKELEFLGIVNQCSLLVFDARKTPFKNRSIEIMTSNLGLSNVENPGTLFKELRRIISGKLYAIHFFVPENDIEHRSFIQENNISPFIFESDLIKEVKLSGFDLNIMNICEGIAIPTPIGEIVKSGIDGIPIKETILKWCILELH